MTSESELEATARDIRVGYIAWCRGEVPKAQAAAEFDRFLARVKAEAWDEGCEAFEEAHRNDRVEPWLYLIDNPYREDEDDE